MAGKKENNSKNRSAASQGSRKNSSSGAKKSTDSTGSARKNSAGASGSKRSAASRSASSGKKPKKNPAGSRMRDEIVAIFMVALGIFLLASLMTEATGEFGEIFSMVLEGLFGLVAYILPFFLIIYALLILMDRMAHVNSRSVFFSVLLYIDIAMLNSARYIKAGTTQPWMKFMTDSFYDGSGLKSAGAVGMAVGRVTAAGIGTTGLVIAGIAVAAVCVIVIADTPVSVFFDGLREKRNNRLIERQRAYEEQENDVYQLPDGNDAEEKTDRKISDAAAVPADNASATTKEAPDERSGGIFAGLFGKKAVKSTAAPRKTEYDDAARDTDSKSISGTGPVISDRAEAEKNDGLRSVFNDAPATERSEQSASPFANLRIKGAGLFRNSAPTRDLFSDLPDNQRRIMNYMSDDEIFGGGSSDGVYYPDDDELNSYKAADFFYEIKNIPNMEENAEDKNDAAAFTDGDSFDSWLDENIAAASVYDTSVDDENKNNSIYTAETAADEQPQQRYSESNAADQAAPVPVPQQMTRGQMRAAAAQGAADISASLQSAQPPAKKEYKLPPISLLHASERKINRNEQKELAAKAARLEQVLHDFGVNARVIDVKKGPSVTRYEIQPATGVKVNSITKLADDIALNLEAKSLRIEAPIPGKAAVGIEVENESSSTVTMREMVESPEFENSKSKISFVVGEDISGNHVVADLKGMPHLLIAGSTGSGKSVCINSLIISMIYKSTPDEVKFILIDPKVVELGNYNGIPHMLIPVVTDPSKAAAALAWAVQEMNDRYKKFAETSVRKLEEYNKKMEKEGKPENVLPQIVIIIDELADLMMAASKQVEESICRLAQLARAAGMHLVVATQRPSVDVVTGLIKANIPSRIAFAVSSQVDSRTILDRAGAEKLVGKGDMLFYPLGKAQPERLQGPFVTDDEVEAVIDFWKEQSDGNDQASRIMAAINTVMPEVNADGDEDEDELLPEAIELVVTSGQASASMLQRRYRIGYNRAGRLIDIMEARGIIGPSEGSKPRKVLMSKEEYAQQQAAPAAASAPGVQNTAPPLYTGAPPETAAQPPYTNAAQPATTPQPTYSDAAASSPPPAQPAPENTAGSAGLPDGSSYYYDDVPDTAQDIMTAPDSIFSNDYGTAELSSDE